MNKETALGFLKCVKHCLKGMDWSLCCGTLLGAIREGDFIDWDLDIDILMRYKYRNKLPEIVACLKKQGCNAAICRDYKQPFIQLGYKGVSGHIGVTLNPTYGRYWYQKFFVGKMRMVNIRGEDFPVPEKAEELLTERYGDWKKPLSVREWNALWKKTKEKEFIKLNIDNKDKLKNIE